MPREFNEETQEWNEWELSDADISRIIAEFQNRYPGFVEKINAAFPQEAPDELRFTSPTGDGTEGD